MILHDAVIAAAKKRDTTGVYRDWQGNIWQVYRARDLETGEWNWGANIIFPMIVDEEQPA